MADHKRIRAMYNTGFKVKDIAERCGCSRRTVHRVVSNTAGGTKVADKEVEKTLRNFFREFEGCENAAARFGISRQGLLK